MCGRRAGNEIRSVEVGKPEDVQEVRRLKQHQIGKEEGGKCQQIYCCILIKEKLYLLFVHDKIIWGSARWS